MSPLLHCGVSIHINVLDLQYQWLLHTLVRTSSGPGKARSTLHVARNQLLEASEFVPP